MITYQLLVYDFKLDKTVFNLDCSNLYVVKEVYYNTVKEHYNLDRYKIELYEVNATTYRILDRM